MLTDGRRTKSDGNSSHDPWSGELKTTKTYELKLNIHGKNVIIILPVDKFCIIPAPAAWKTISVPSLT